MPQMQFDFDGLIQLLAGHLYSEKKVFIRELIQNAHDSIVRRQAAEHGGYGGRIDIDTRPQEDRIVVRDNGIGMSQGDLKQYLSSIGKSGTDLERAHVEGLIGQFGIGFLSAFVVAGRVEVRTRKLGEDRGWMWTNEGSKTYTLNPCDIDAPGTTVTVLLKGPEERGAIHEETVRDVVRQYADMLLVPIHLNGGGDPINTMHMPWEKTGRSENEIKLDCHIYLEKTMQSSVLQAIPVRLSDPAASGVLFVTRTRTLQIEAPRTVRVFQNRMFLCENSEVLPRWAGFVEGVINTPVLTPTAARDNFIRDENHRTLRDALGDLVVEHLEKLHESDPERFSQILRYHNLSIKAACYYYDPFFAKFAHLLEWRTNGGERDETTGDEKECWRTLPAILEEQPTDADGRKVLPCFTTSNSANQYFQMADAAGSVVVDASYPFENHLIEAYAELDDVHVRLVHVDHEDDPNVFRHLVGNEQARMTRLAEVMAQVLRAAMGHQIRVEARQFDPPELGAVIRSTERSRGQHKAQGILNDPTMPEDLREMAREMMKLSRYASLRLTVNATNPFVKRLALQNLEDPDVVELMRGVYNNAIIYSQELMTPHNARVFHDQFDRLMGRVLEFVETGAELDAERRRIRRQHEENAARKGPGPRHRVLFMMTPFADDYRPLVDALREVVEDQWGCQLYVASDRQYDDRVFENVGRHMAQAHAFIAEVTDANPNVMFELGAAKYDLHQRPIVLLRKADSGMKLPADLHGHIYINYADTGDLSLEGHLAREMRKNHTLASLLDDAEREHYLSPRELKRLTRFPQLPDEAFVRLTERFPTREQWRHVGPEDVRAHLGDEGDLAPAFIKRVHEA